MADFDFLNQDPPDQDPYGGTRPVPPQHPTMGLPPVQQQVDIPFTQSDSLYLQRLQSGLSEINKRLDAGELYPHEHQELSAQILPRMQVLQARQQKAQSVAQQAQKAALLDQTAIQEAVRGVHLQKVMDELPALVRHVVDPLTGAAESYVPLPDGKGGWKIEPVEYKHHHATLDRLEGASSQEGAIAEDTQFGGVPPESGHGQQVPLSPPDRLASGEANPGMLLSPNAYARQLHNPGYRTTHSRNAEEDRQARLANLLGLPPLAEEMGPHRSEAQLPGEEPPVAPPESQPQDSRPYYNLRDQQGHPVQTLEQFGQEQRQKAGLAPQAPLPRILNAAGEDITAQQQQAYERFRRTGSWAPEGQPGSNEGQLSQQQIAEMHARAERAVPQLRAGASEYEVLARQKHVQDLVHKQIDHLQHLDNLKQYRKLQSEEHQRQESAKVAERKRQEKAASLEAQRKEAEKKAGRDELTQAKRADALEKAIAQNERHKSEWYKGAVVGGPNEGKTPPAHFTDPAAEEKEIQRLYGMRLRTLGILHEGGAVADSTPGGGGSSEQTSKAVEAIKSLLTPPAGGGQTGTPINPTGDSTIGPERARELLPILQEGINNTSRFSLNFTRPNLQEMHRILSSSVASGKPLSNEQARRYQELHNSMHDRSFNDQQKAGWQSMALQSDYRLKSQGQAAPAAEPVAPSQPSSPPAPRNRAELQARTQAKQQRHLAYLDSVIQSMEKAQRQGGHSRHEEALAKIKRARDAYKAAAQTGSAYGMDHRQQAAYDQGLEAARQFRAPGSDEEG